MQRVMIYLHGFLSSPESAKATQMRHFMAEYFPKVKVEVPTLANFPAAALKQACALAKEHAGKELAFVGSSMGGFLATHLAHRYGGRAVLINPAVHPHLLLKNGLGEQQNPYTGARFTLTDVHLHELEQLDIRHLDSPERFWVLLQRGDEILDYRLALALYEGCHLTLEEGGSHAFEGFERYLSDIAGFVWAKPEGVGNIKR